LRSNAGRPGEGALPPGRPVPLQRIDEIEQRVAELAETVRALGTRRRWWPFGK